MVEQQSASGEIFGWRDYVRFIKERPPIMWPEGIHYTTGQADALFKLHQIEHFSFTETRMMRRAGLLASHPPSHWLHRIIPPLWFAEALRLRLRELYGPAFYLSVGNGFRPSPKHPELRSYYDANRAVGGSPRSKHIVYRALDLDPPWCLVKDGTVRRSEVIGVAMDLFHQIRNHVVAGIGTYRGSCRIHIDIGPQDKALMGRWDRMRDAVWGPKKDRSIVLPEGSKIR